MTQNKRPRGRPKSLIKKIELRLWIPRGLKKHLTEAAATHICGGQTAREAAIYLINDGINRLIEQGKIGPKKVFEHHPIEPDEDDEAPNESSSI